MMEKKEKELIYSKIPKIMAAIGAVGKNRKNSQQGYTFRGIDDMYNALNKHLAKEGVFASSEILEKSREERETRNGGVLIYSMLTMKFRFFAEDGSSIESITIGEAMDTGDKSMNKAMSVAYKYAMMQLFCIPTNDDKDPENNTHKPKYKKKANNAKATTQTTTQKKVTYNEEDTELIRILLERYPKDKFLLSVRDFYKKAGKLTTKQRASLEEKLDQPYGEPKETPKDEDEIDAEEMARIIN